MPIQVQGPDGAIIEFPDGTQPEVMQQAMAAHYSAKPSFADVAGSATTKPDLANTQIDGVANKDVPGWKNALYGAVSPIADTIVGVGQATGLMDEGKAHEAMQRIDAVRSRTPGKVAGFGGDVAMALALPEARGVGLAGKVAQQALAGAAYGASRGTHEGESRATNATVGGVLGGAGQAIGSAVSNAGEKAATAIAPEIRKLYEAAKARGINLSPAQLSDSRLMKFAQAQLGMLPLSGGEAKTAAQRAAWNREVSKTIGIDAPAITPAVYAHAKARDSQVFERLTSRNNLKVTPGLMESLQAVKQEATMAGDDAAKAASAAVDQFIQRIKNTDGAVIVPGRAYQSLDSQLGRVARLGNEASHYVGRVQGLIRDAMDESISPQDQAAWRKAREYYGNRKTIRDLVAKGDGIDLSPQALMGRVTANNSGKERMASESRGDLGELARIGQRMKPPPSSGTAERSLANSAMNPMMWPALAIGGTTGAMVGRAANSDALAQFLLRQNRGQGARMIGPYLRPLAIAGSPLVTQQFGGENANP